MPMPRKAQATQYIRRVAVARVRGGQKQVDVARFLGVSVRSVQRWIKLWDRCGASGLVAKPPPGRPPRLTATQSSEIISWLSRSAAEFGFVTERWTAPRVAALIDRRMGIEFNPRYLNRWLAQHGITPQIPDPTPRERNQALVDWWVANEWPQVRKMQADCHATLVFTDESGFLMAPLRRSSLAPIGQTPVIRPRAKHRQKVSVAAALCRSPDDRHARLLYEPFVDRYVDNFFYAEFLHETLRRIRGPVALLHDGAALHHGDWTEELMNDFPRIEVHEFPPYAPELNPVEQLWNWTKDYQLANYIPTDLTELAIAVDSVIADAGKDQHRLSAFFEASALPW
jgi:transposase